MRGERFLSVAAWLSAVGAALLGLMALLAYGDDVPFLDDWEFLKPGQFPRGFRWGWLWEQHNEHRIVTTKLLSLLFLYVDGWNLLAMQVANYLIFLVGIALVGAVGKRWAPKLPLWVWPAFLVFLMSPRIQEDHTWAFQVQFHLTWIFLVAAAGLWFTAEPSSGRSLAGAAMAVLAMVSTSGGIVEVAALLSVYGVFRLTRGEVRHLALAAVPCVVMGALWFVGYAKPDYHPPFVLPDSPDFWTFFVNVVSLGYGIELQSAAFGWLCVFLTVSPLVLLLVPDWRRRSAEEWGVVGLVVAVLALLASIAVGRAGFNDLHWSKLQRYAELAGLLIPLAVLSWARLLDGLPSVRRRALAGLWIFCLVAFHRHWNYAKFYGPPHAQRERGLACIRAYYAGTGDGNCRDLYPAPLGQELDAAKGLNLSFYRGVMSSASPSTPP